MLVTACPPPPQAQWAKSNYVAADVVQIGGEQALEAIASLEKGSAVSGNTLRCMEGMSTPEDVLKVLSKVQADPRPTASLLRSVAAEVQDDRRWTWLLCHPDLTPEHIHPSRSMLPPCHPCVVQGGVCDWVHWQAPRWEEREGKWDCSWIVPVFGKGSS